MEESVKISLWFLGDEMPLEQITSILEIEPTRMRKKAEWRIQNEYTCDEWRFDLEEIQCADVEILFQKFIKIFETKTELIKKICSDYNCKVSIVVVIYMENSSQPYTCLSANTIAFLHLIGTELTFDIYGFDKEDMESYD